MNDLALVAFVDGHEEECFLIKRITNDEDQIPALAQAGNMVKYARAGKKAYFGSDTKIGIARPDIDPTNPMVLGDILVNGLTALINAFLNAAQVGQCAVGPVYLDPSVRSALTSFNETYLTTEDSNIISQIAFTERGS